MVPLVPYHDIVGLRVHLCASAHCSPPSAPIASSMCKHPTHTCCTCTLFGSALDFGLLALIAMIILVGVIVTCAKCRPLSCQSPGTSTTHTGIIFVNAQSRPLRNGAAEPRARHALTAYAVVQWSCKREVPCYVASVVTAGFQVPTRLRFQSDIVC
jgi:hypothetical protein